MDTKEDNKKTSYVSHVEAGLGEKVQAQRLSENSGSTSASIMTRTPTFADAAQALTPWEGNRPPPPAFPVTTQPPHGHSTNSPSPSSLIQTLQPYTGEGVNGDRSAQRKKNISLNIKNRKIKKLLRTEDLFKEENFPTYYVLTFPGINIYTELNVIAADSEIRRKIGNPKKISKLNKNSLMIQITAEKQGKILRELKTVSGHPTVCEPHRSLNIVKGTVLSETMGNIPMDDLLTTLENQGVSKIERIKRKVENELRDTNRYIITFNRTKLPPLLKLTEWHHEIVETYVPKPARCTRCQTFGHFRKWCNKDRDLCVRCGGDDHFAGECTNDPKCVNCSGNHPANSTDCPTYIFRSEVMATMAKMHILHSEAMDIVKEQYRQDGIQYSTITRRSNQPTTSNNNSQQERPVDEPRTPSVRPRRPSPPPEREEPPQSNQSLPENEAPPRNTDAPSSNREENKTTENTPEQHSKSDVKTKTPHHNTPKFPEKSRKTTNSQPNPKPVVSNQRSSPKAQRSRSKSPEDKQNKQNRLRSSSLKSSKRSTQDDPKNNPSLTTFKGTRNQIEDYQKRKRESSSDHSPSSQVKIIKSDRIDQSSSSSPFLPPTPPPPPPLPSQREKTKANTYELQRRRGSFNIPLVGDPP